MKHEMLSKRKYMSNYLKIERKSVVEKLACQKRYPVPAVGDYIIYNEVFLSHDKRDGLPCYGIGEVVGINGVMVSILRMGTNDTRFHVSITAREFMTGWFTFVRISHLPEQCPEYSELEIGNLSPALNDLVIEGITYKIVKVI